jgi:putative FmdB family regulatory protein
MPLYEYECESCGHRFERIRKFSDPPLEICPKCGGHVRKLISSPAIQFKGSGWYVNDYPKSGKADSGKSEKSESSKSDSGTASSKSDTAPAEKSDASKPSTSSDSSSSSASTPAPAKPSGSSS